MTLAGRKGSGEGGEAADDSRPGALEGPDGVAPPDTVVASYDPRAVALLRGAVRQVLPDTIMHVAAAPEPTQLLLATLQPALVLLDLNFTDPSSPDLIGAAQGANPRASVVVVAGHGDDDRILPALRRGASGVVVKYDTPGVIAAQLRNAVAGVLPLTPALARQAIRHADAGGPDAALSAPEWELLAWVAAGDTLPEVAARTRQDPRDLQRLVDNVYQRMALRGRSRTAPPAGRPDE